MGEQRDRMLAGELYRDDDPELVAERRACARLLARFHDAGPDDDGTRADALGAVLGSIGSGTVIMPRFQCDYGYLVRIGADSFVNYDAIFLDCAPITIGDNVFVGPRVQLLTPLHPMDDLEARRAGWESAAPVTIGDDVWLGGGVIVCPGVTVGPGSVIGAGSVVTRDIPGGVFAAGNPCQVKRSLGNRSGA